MPIEPRGPMRDETHRFGISLPRPLWIGLATLILVLVAIGLRIGVPIYQQQTAIHLIEQLGGSYESRPGGPEWLRHWLGDERMKPFDQVVVVNLDNTEATDATMRHIGWLTNLQEFYVGSTRVTDSGLVHVRGLRNLEMLWLNSPRISDAGLRHLKELAGLQTLLLNDTQVTDVGLADLKRLSSLQVLWLDNTAVTNEGVADLTRSLPALHFVHTTRMD